MHWGIRRYQPYGEGGYDPDHEGKNIGLAARLAGHTGSYSDAIRRGSSLGSRAKTAASSLGKRAGRAVNEGLERLNYANDRLGEGIKSAGKRASSAADRAKRAIGEAAIDAKFFATRYTSEERRAVTDFYKKKVQDSLSGAMGKVKTGSRDFMRNAAATAALFGGALDPRSNASQTLSGRYDNGASKSIGAIRKDYSGYAPGTKFGSISDLLDPGSRGKTRNYDPRAAIRTQMLTDLGSGRNLGKNRGPLSRQSSYDSARQRDLIRSAGGASKRDNGLYGIGDRINVFGEVETKGGNKFENRRKELTDPYERRWGGPLAYDRDRTTNNDIRAPHGMLEQSRYTLLKDLSSKDKPSQKQIEKAQSFVDDLFETYQDRENIRKMRNGAMDPYIARTLGIGRK